MAEEVGEGTKVVEESIEKSETADDSLRRRRGLSLDSGSIIEV